MKYFEFLDENGGFYYEVGPASRLTRPSTVQKPLIPSSLAHTTPGSRHAPQLALEH
jgi:hypothetical protein